MLCAPIILVLEGDIMDARLEALGSALAVAAAAASSLSGDLLRAIVYNRSAYYHHVAPIAEAALILNELVPRIEVVVRSEDEISHLLTKFTH